MDASRRAWPAPELRAGDADRQAVVSELQQHYIQGRLTSDELGERVTQALNARTFGDLRVPLADLPPLDADQPLSPPAWPGRDRQADGPPERHPGGWPANAPPLGAVLGLIGLLALLWVIAIPTFHVGVAPFWPLLFFVFFIGRPRGGGRRY
jgi:hypothetical protein